MSWDETGSPERVGLEVTGFGVPTWGRQDAIDRAKELIAHIPQVVEWMDGMEEHALRVKGYIPEDREFFSIAHWVAGTEGESFERQERAFNELYGPAAVQAKNEPTESSPGTS